MSATVVTAGLDIQAQGVSVRLSFSLAPASAEPLSEGSRAAFEGFEDQNLLVQAVIRSAVESRQQLIEAFERAQSILLESSTLLVERQLATLKGESSEGGAA